MTQHVKTESASRRAAWAVALACVLNAACSHVGGDGARVSRQLEDRIGARLATPESAEEFRLPEGLSLDDGVSEDEAVAVALYNNRRFAVSLVDLELARASLIEAGMIRNPVAQLLFPVGPKQLESTVTWPLDFLLKRPRRIAAARRAGEETTERVIQSALDLARDAKVAHAELWLARERARLAREGADVLAGIARLTHSRFTAGDISALEADTARADALAAEDRALRTASDAALARERLALLLGIPGEHPLDLTPPSDARLPLPPLDALLAQSAASRPELRAAEMAADAARKRVGVADADWLVFSGILDMNAQGKEGFEAGPGVSVEVPLMPASRGTKARARAELERDVRRWREVRQRVAMEVRSAHRSALDARASDERLRTQLVPLLETVAARAEKAFRTGDVAYLFVLESQRRYLDVRVLSAEAQAAVRRTEAALEQSVGTALAHVGQMPPVTGEGK